MQPMTQTPTTRNLGAAAWLFVVGLFLIALFGGQLRLGLSIPIDEQSLFYRALIGRSEAAIGHLLIALPIVLAVAIAAFRKGVLQIPSMGVWLMLSALFFWLAIGVPASPTRYAAIVDFARWVSAFAALVGCCFLLGRDKGPRIAAYALFAGMAVLGVIGFAEFAYQSQIAANWRIFAGWHNPNALAGILIVGLPLGMGLFVGAEERLEKLLLGFGMGAILCALWFTGSKGGILAATVGIVAFALISLIKRGLPAGWWKGILVALIAGAGLILLFGLGAWTAGTSSVAGRLGEGGAAEQSVGFRSQLWKDSAKVIASRPFIGHGAGSYSITIRKEGNTLGSELAHQTYLQIAAEIGIVGLAIAIGLIVVWLFTVLRKHPSEPPERAALRYAIVAAVLAIGANGLVESNLSYFGIRMALFALLGIGLNLSVDGLVPERVPVALRAVVASLLAIGVGYTLVGAAIADNAVSRALGVMSDRPGEAQRLLQFAHKVAPADPQPMFQLAKLASAMNDWETARALAETAARRNPDASSYSVLAHAEGKLGNRAEAVAAMDAAIAAEPNDPYWRAQKFELLREMAMYDDAEAAARDAIQAEERLETMPNALPWLVSTDTIAARQWLIGRATSTPERAELLQGLFDQLALYAERTATELANVTHYAAIAEVKRKLGAGASEQKIADELNLPLDEYRAYRQTLEQTPMVGETIELARQKQELLGEVGEELERIYRSEGKSEEADAVRARLDAVEEAGVLK